MYNREIRKVVFNIKKRISSLLYDKFRRSLSLSERKRRNYKMVSLTLSTLSIGLLTFCLGFPITTNAITLKPENITILNDMELYDDYKVPAHSVGSLTALQTLHVIDVDREWKPTESIVPKWYLVETWLGNKWIQSNENIINGKYYEDERYLTTQFEVSLFDKPDQQYPTSLKISPQKVKSNAYIDYSPLVFHNTISFSSSTGKWYQIKTWLGDKWIWNPAILENAKEVPISYDLKLTDEEIVYPTPFRVETLAERIDPQVVKVIAKWDARKGPHEVIWYKLQLPQGIRWIAPKHLAIQDIRTTSETVTLLTETRYSDKPLLNLDDKLWLEAGTYNAFEASGKWMHIDSPKGQVWVNPQRALLERPVGINKTDETIQLTKESQTFRYPLTGEIAHIQGFYAPQTIKTFEKWDGGGDGIWYHIHGFGIDEWVKV